MRIIQLTDLHIVKSGFAFREADSAQNLTQTIDYILRYDLRPDATVITGDVTNDGAIESYRTVQKELSRLQCPCYILPGNHDNRENLKRVFGEFGCVDAPADLNDANLLETKEASLLFLDSTIPGKSYGGISQASLTWLKNHLPDKQRTTLVFLHHAPFKTGYTLMDEPFVGESELLEMLRDRENTIVCCGHIHTGIVVRYAGTLCVACPPVSMMMSPDFSPAEGDTFYTGPASFAIHEITERQIRSYFCTVPGHENKGPFRFLE